MNISNQPNQTLVMEGKEIQFVEKFTYLGSVISKDNGAKTDITSKLSKARHTFSLLTNIWRSSKYSMKTKLKLYNSNVKSVLLYGSECWRVMKGDMNKVSSFHNTCLRRICRIFWPNQISNAELHSRTNSIDIQKEIKRMTRISISIRYDTLIQLEVYDKCTAGLEQD